MLKQLKIIHFLTYHSSVLDVKWGPNKVRLLFHPRLGDVHIAGSAGTGTSGKNLKTKQNYEVRWSIDRYYILSDIVSNGY